MDSHPQQGSLPLFQQSENDTPEARPPPLGSYQLGDFVMQQIYNRYKFKSVLELLPVDQVTKKLHPCLNLNPESKQIPKTKNDQSTLKGILFTSTAKNE